MVLEIVIFFALLLVTTMIIAVLPGTISGRFWITLPVCALALAATAAIFVGIEHDGPGASALGLSAILLMLVMRGLQRQWSFLGAQLFVAVAVASLSYLVYAAFQTFLAGLPVVAVIASVILLFFETCALLLSISFTFEICDVLARQKEPRIVPPLTRLPWVALQVPSYNEPVEVVRPTLEALARVNYPNLIIQVVDNNTTDEAVWRPLEQLCHDLGPRFAFVHLEDWPGFKAGALNESTKYLPEEVEILGIVDADYRVHPQWLQDTIGHFDDPAVAFVQTSQHYRDWEDNPYLRGLFYSFRYFFDLTMPARNHRNAIIFCGTMGLIRRSAFSEIGGWNEACITEDAEASLRMLGAGYKGIYDSAAYGEGLMPLNFDGLKKQRFRWALGGVQILKFHWRELIPLARHRMKLTMSQRIHYLLGSVQWFAEVLTAIFTILLLATALATVLHHRLPVRQLTGAVLAIPLAFAASGVMRALWAMRRACGTTYRDALTALRVWFALSWIVTLACLRGLVQKRAEFLRTPKSKQGGSLLSALRASRMETALTVAAVLGGLALVVRSPAVATLVLGLLLFFEAFVYLNAPWASMAAEGIILTPERQAYSRSPQNTGDRPAWRRSAVFLPVGVASAIAAAAVVALVALSPSADAPFSGPQQDLPRIGTLAPNFGVGPTPTLSASASPTPSPATSASPSGTPSAAPSSTPTPTPTPTALPSPIASPSPT
jgi:cellulose synthase/poly-beta-1,6-N-acetylglucosamine synthase-like glycosyltransferase